MKKIVALFFILILFFSSFFVKLPQVFADEPPMLAIVIDDFGQSRRGVEQMLACPCTLTCAIMPGLEHSTEDAENAYEKGHEVILHMPMEAHVTLPDSWYGPKVIRNFDSEEKVKKLLSECIDSIPHCKGVNIHIGSGVCRNEKLMTAILEETKNKGKYFLDSKTNLGSVCDFVATVTNVDYASRDFFLEKTGCPDYNHAKRELKKAAELALKQGYAIAIGHVGPEGGVSTARAIADSIKLIENMGVKIVPLSKIVEKTNKNKHIA